MNGDNRSAADPLDAFLDFGPDGIAINDDTTALFDDQQHVAALMDDHNPTTDAHFQQLFADFAAGQQRHEGEEAAIEQEQLEHEHHHQEQIHSEVLILQQMLAERLAESSSVDDLVAGSPPSSFDTAPLPPSYTPNTLGAMTAMEQLDLASAASFAALTSPALRGNNHGSAGHRMSSVSSSSARVNAGHPYATTSAASSTSSVLSATANAASRKPPSGRFSRSSTASPAFPPMLASWPSSAIGSPLLMGEQQRCASSASGTSCSSGGAYLSPANAMPGLTPQSCSTSGSGNNGTGVASAAAGSHFTTMPMLTLPDAADSASGVFPLTPASLMRLDGGVVDGSAAATANAASDSSSTAFGTQNTLPEAVPVDASGAVPLHDHVRRQLAEHSNYQNLAAGKSGIADLHFPPGTTLPGPSNIAATIDARKNYHKNAEQRRRDTAKAWFDGLRSLLPNLTERVPSKLHVLEKTYEYLCTLKQGHEDMHVELVATREELDRLRRLISAQIAELPKTTPSALDNAPTTVSKR